MKGRCHAEFISASALRV